MAPNRSWRCPDPHCGTSNSLEVSRCAGCQLERSFEPDFTGSMRLAGSLPEFPGERPDMSGPRGRGRKAQERQAMIMGSPRPGGAKNPGVRIMEETAKVRELEEECQTLKSLNLDVDLGAIFDLRLELNKQGAFTEAETDQNELEPYAEFLKKVLDVVRESHFKKYAVLETSKKFYETCLNLPSSDDVAAMQDDLKKGAVDTLAKVIGDYLHAFPSFDILEIYPELETQISQLKERCQVSRVNPRPLDMTKLPIEIPVWLGQNLDSHRTEAATRSKQCLDDFTDALEQVVVSLKGGNPPEDKPELSLKAKKLREALDTEFAGLSKPTANHLEDSLRTILEHFVWLRERIFTLWEQYSSTFALAQELETNHQQVIIHKSKHPLPDSLLPIEDKVVLGTVHEEERIEHEVKSNVNLNQSHSDDNLSEIEDDD